jgi:hypothetical protein
MSQGAADSAGRLGSASLIARGCLTTLFLVFVVLPVAGFAFAVWLLLTPTSSETAATTAYRNTPACSSLLPEQSCIQTERAEIVSFSSIPGRCGSHTDRFTLKLADGLHTAEIPFDCLAADASYGWSDGRVNVHEYRGLVTTVYDAAGKAYETTDSPSRGNGWRRGVAVVMLIVLGSWLIVVAIIAVGVRFTKRARPSSL